MVETAISGYGANLAQIIRTFEPSSSTRVKRLLRLVRTASTPYNRADHEESWQSTKDIKSETSNAALGCIESQCWLRENGTGTEEECCGRAGSPAFSSTVIAVFSV